VSIATPADAPAADVKAVTTALAEPFGRDEVKFKPQSVKGNRALAMAYVDARVVQDRLDDVLGVENWQDEYETLADGSVICKLTCRLGDRWITKMDVGGPSEQPDGGDRLKAAVSDALKRAAVKFGVGRYLYRLPAQWADYDPVKRQFSSPPALPAFATPKPKLAATPAARAEPDKSDAKGKASVKPGPGLPANGGELHQRLREYDKKLSDQKVCPVGALLSHVAQAGEQKGYGPDITAWDGDAIPFAVAAVKAFESEARGGPKSAVRPATAA
jgi:hypothetical protein